jgi:5'-nucleotidase
MRVFRSASTTRAAVMQRGVFTRGAPPWRYLRPLGAQPVPVGQRADVREALAMGVPAAQVLPAIGAGQRSHPHEVRIAFDGDAVLFSTRPSGCSRPKG